MEQEEQEEQEEQDEQEEQEDQEEREEREVQEGQVQGCPLNRKRGSWESRMWPILRQVGWLWW
jgi:hypothetical protein